MDYFRGASRRLAALGRRTWLEGGFGVAFASDFLGFGLPLGFASGTILIRRGGARYVRLATRASKASMLASLS